MKKKWSFTTQEIDSEFLYFYLMGKSIFVIFFLSLVGCKNFETKKVSSQDILRRQLQQFDWNEVDTYPSFDSCKELLEKPELKKCFETTLTKHFYEALAKHEIASSDSINGTMILYLEISAEGKPAIDSIAMSNKLSAQVPKLKNWIVDAIEELPDIYPAHARGIPVATKFVVPIRVISE